MPLQTAVVIGATGLTGGHVVRALLEDSAFKEVVVLVRGRFALLHPKLTVRTVDFTDSADYRNKLGKGDVIFSCIGTTQKQVKGDSAAYRKIDYDIPVNAAVFGKQAGFNTFLLVSSIGASPKSANFYLKLKGEVDEAVSSAGLPSVNIFRPSLLLGKRNEKRFGEGIMQSLGKGLSFLLGGKLRKYKPIEASAVATAMVASAKNAVPGNHVYEYDGMMELVG
jgi:uncharacterized protein YbjT (DUF2867 family)